MERQFLALLILMHSCLMIMSYCLAMKHTDNIATDTSALLALKAHITSDPLQILSKNWSSPSYVCYWTGVQCGHLHRRVTALNISGMALTGTIPPHLGNLSFLVSLDMTANHFHGTLPRELARLRRIRYVRLGSNNFSGPVPTWVGPKLQLLALYENDFSGVIPSSISNLSKLEFLNIRKNSLTGKIPEEMGNLHSLRTLNLGHNSLVGSIPSSIFNISTLEIVALTSNNLTGSLPYDTCHHLPNLRGLYLSYNLLNGEIPLSLSHCSQLQTLSLSYNNFIGSIPKQLGDLEMLEVLALGGNNLQGVFPVEITNLTNLKVFGMEANKISGEIPEEIGNLYNLEELNVEYNDLSDSIPIRIFNLSTLSVIAFGGNHLTGNLPSNIDYQFANLEYFDLGINNFSGVIPVSIVNCSKLKFLCLASNHFSGSIPKSLGNLELLEHLLFSDNQLTSDPTSLELDFLTSLEECKSLKIIELSHNPLSGILPNTIGNLSTSLQKFCASMNNISGPIPREIGNLTSLISVDLSNNQLTGEITVQNLQNLQGLYLSGNKLRGSLDQFCDMQKLVDLILSQNLVSESIPDCFGNMTSLRTLDLHYNLLTSSIIPKSFWKLTDLMVLDLSSNSLNVGPLPLEIGNLKAIISMDLSTNQLSGVIPRTLGDLQNLQHLSLANNQLNGFIPESMGKMLSLTSLDLSNNNLSGFIPKSLEALRSLKVLNVSSNHLRGEIPSGGPFKNLTSKSFLSNDALCGDLKFQVPKCKTTQKHKLTVKKLLILTLIPLVVSILVVVGFIYIFWRRQWKRKVPSAANASIVPTKQRISYYELQQATNRYSDSNFLGAGSFGSVYKGILSDGKVVAIKVFNLQLERSLKSFDVECEVLCNLRHRNLLKVITSCSNQDFKALVLEYMSNGSLEKWLHSDHLFLNVLQRLNIMIDVACAVQYLHQEYFTPVIHCDLKPSNILIDEDLVAYVSDFGIAKFLGNDESFTLTKNLATVGYIAPEYGGEGLVSKACDVYSYGILLMEVFTRRRPNDEIFGESLNLKSWVNDCMPNSVVDVIDANLLNANEEEQSSSQEIFDCISSIMELALNCASNSPKERPTISDVLHSLNKINVKYVATCHG